MKKKRKTRRRKRNPSRKKNALLRNAFSLWRGGRDSNIISPVEAHDRKKNALLRNVFSMAGRAGFEPATELPRHSLSRRAHSAALAPPQEGNKLLQVDGGGSGIRTHVGVTQTCFQDMRLQPLGHPSRLEDFTITLIHNA